MTVRELINNRTTNFGYRINHNINYKIFQTNKSTEQANVLNEADTGQALKP